MGDVSITSHTSLDKSIILFFCCHAWPLQASIKDDAGSSFDTVYFPVLLAGLVLKCSSSVCAELFLSAPQAQHFCSLHQTSPATQHFSALMLGGCHHIKILSSPVTRSHPQNSSHCSTCSLLREQTDFRSQIVKWLKVFLWPWKKTVTFLYKTTCWWHPFYSYFECHSHWKDPSCFWAA